MMITNALSVDVEEYYHGMEFEAAVPGDGRDYLPSRVEASVDRVLAMLSLHGIRATFFTVGRVAEGHPAPSPPSSVSPACSRAFPENRTKSMPPVPTSLE